MLFRFLVDPYMVIRSTAKIRQAIINEDIPCGHEPVSMLKQGTVTYIYMYMLDNIEGE